MSGSAVFLPYAHEFFLLHDGPTTLPPPFELVATIGGVSIHLFQNTTSEEVTVSTGNSARPTVLVPPGDTLVATAGGSTNALLVGRFPFAGRRFTNVLLSAVDPPTYPGQAFTAGTAFLALAGVRGDCGGSTPGTIRVGWPVGNVTGWPNTLAEATGVATQPAGDANGNLSAGWFTLLTTDANLPLSGGHAYSGFCGVAALNFIRTTFLIAETEPLALGPFRVRSSVSEDAGSLFQATQAVAVELGISEAFEYGTDVSSGLRAFREALTPDEVALRYYAVPTRNTEMLTTVEGETNLGRLAHTIAPRIFTRGTSIPGNDGGVVTAQQAIQHVVNRWSSEHPWLVFEPIPDLRLLVPAAVNAPRQYYLDNPDAGVLTTSNVVIEQEGNDRRTMREVLDEWLQVFPGTIVRQTSAGTIELVPRVGPDAPDGAALTLTWRDLARMSGGENDPRGIYNRARVTSQGWDWSEDTPLLPPSYIFSADGNGLRRSVLESEEVMPSAREEAWPNSIISFAVLNDGNPVAVDLLITAFGSWSRTAASSFSVEGSAPHQFTLARGQRRDVSITHWTRAVSVTSRWRFERLAAPGPDVLYVTPLHVVPGAYNPFGSTYLAYLLEFDVTGMAWTKSNEQATSEFGQSGDHVPAEGGGNALDQSRSLYGERTATINSTVFQLDSTQARQVAESFVLHNINPRTIREVQQSEWEKYPVKFDHIGRYVELPNGEVAVVENRSYSDSFAPRASAMMSTFTATVSHSVIDTTTEFMYLDSGDYAQLDDGTLVEAS